MLLVKITKRLSINNMPGAKLPPEIIRHWPEVFKDIEVELIPMEYISAIEVEFHNGDVWIIDCKAKASTEETDIAETLEELLSEYEESIENVDLRIDSAKVKRDIQKTTRAFLKNPKKFRKRGDGS